VGSPGYRRDEDVASPEVLAVAVNCPGRIAVVMSAQLLGDGVEIFGARSAMVVTAAAAAIVTSPWSRASRHRAGGW
jgi:hypothetical protein